MGHGNPDKSQKKVRKKKQKKYRNYIFGVCNVDLTCIHNFTAILSTWSTLKLIAIALKSLRLVQTRKVGH